MAIHPIVHYPNKILNIKCERVSNFDVELHRLLDDMYETMIAEDGVGLAAPQIGCCRQIAIVDIGEEKKELIEMVNPELIMKKGYQVDIEGCLSIPGVYGKVTRSSVIGIRACDRYGNEFSLTAEGYLARAIQHEIDHLHGILFISKVTEYVDESELE